MNFRDIVLPIVGVLCLTQSALPQTIAIAKGKHPSVVVKDADGETVTSIPVDGDERVPLVKVAFSKAANTFYVLNRKGKSKSRSLSAVNVATHRVDRVIDVGTGQHVELLMSNDGRRLFCYKAPKWDASRRYGVLAGWVPAVAAGASAKEGLPPFQDTVALPSPNIRWAYELHRGLKPVVSVIDTASNEVIGTYSWFDSLRAAMPQKVFFFEDRFFATSDGAHLIASFQSFGSPSDLSVNRPAGKQVAIFSGQSVAPAFRIDPTGKVTEMVISPDERFLGLFGERRKEALGLQEVVDPLTGSSVAVAREKKVPRSGFLDIVNLETGGTVKTVLSGMIAAMTPSQDRGSLFVAVAGKGRDPGSIGIVDLTTSNVSYRALNDSPRSLIRLGSKRGMWVLGAREMRSVSETGELGAPILLNKPRKWEEGDKDSADAFLNGYPGETINLGEDHAAILITNKSGGSLHRVALLDLKQLQVDSIVTTMSAGQRAGILAGRIAVAVALDAASAVGAAAGAQALGAFVAPTFVPNLRLANEALAARPDGQFLYTLDTDTHEVTVIGVQAGTVTVRIPVARSVWRLELSPDGTYLSCIGKVRQKIDLASNSMEN